MAIKKIDKDKIETLLKEIVENSVEIKTSKKESDDIVKSLKNNETDFKSGKISSETYKDIKNNLERERKVIESKISEKKKKILFFSKKLSDTLRSNRI